MNQRHATAASALTTKAFRESAPGGVLNKDIDNIHFPCIPAHLLPPILLLIRFCF